MRRFLRFRFRLYAILLPLILILIVIHAVRLNPKIVDRILHSAPTSSPKFHILIPASEPSAELCKTIATAAVLNYPVPTLINWGKNFTEAGKLGGGSHLAKISGINDYIGYVGQKHFEETVLIVDAYDVWFQLPPSVLLARFKRGIEESNRLTKDRMGRAYGEERIRDTVLFGAGKRCAPNFEDDIACYPVPESPLAKDMYGSNTDTATGHNQYSSYRQRYLNSGIIMGPMGDLSQILERALSKKDEPQRGFGGSDQSIYNTMFGEQEYQRLVMHERHLSIFKRIRRQVKELFKPRGPAIIDHHPTHQYMEHFDRRMFDFGIALDYGSSISHQTVNAEWDARFITYANDPPTVVTDEFDCRPDIQGIPRDVQNSYMTSPRVQQGSLMNKTWADLPLYTQMCTGSIPVFVHHNGIKTNRQSLWPKFWMQPMLKDLLKTQQQHIRMASPEDDMIDIGINGGDAFTQSGERLSWSDLCSQYEDEIWGN